MCVVVTHSLTGPGCLLSRSQRVWAAPAATARHASGAAPSSSASRVGGCAGSSRRRGAR
jgi:hypothetical protein